MESTVAVPFRDVNTIALRHTRFIIEQMHTPPNRTQSLRVDAQALGVGIVDVVVVVVVREVVIEVVPAAAGRRGRDGPGGGRGGG